MKQCNFQNNYGVIALREDCSCASIFNFFCRPPEFFLRGKFIQKIIIFFRDFGDCKPTFLKPQRWNLACGCGPRTPSPRPNSVKKTLKGLAKLYQKLSILAILGAVSPHFKSDNGEIWHEGAGLELPPSTPNFVKLLKGMYLLWTNLYQKLTIFFDFGVCKPTFLKPQPWSLAWECTPGSPSPRLILLKSLRGICPLGAKFYQKVKFSRFSATYAHISIP